MTPTLGQPVTFTHSLHRRFEGTDPHRRARKVWEPRPVSWTVPGADTLTGILVGMRTLADGEFRDVGWGGPFDVPEQAFVSTHHFTAYLVAYDLRRKPVHVLPEHTKEDQ